MAKITVALLRELEKKVNSGEISYSRMVEILNQQSTLNEGNLFEFYKTKSDKIGHRGNRFFRFRWDSSQAVQVCLEVGNETKKGKGHYVGVYQISKTTLFTNWYPNYVEPCSEEEFKNAFKQAIDLLSKTTDHE